MKMRTTLKIWSKNILQISSASHSKGHFLRIKKGMRNKKISLKK